MDLGQPVDERAKPHTLDNSLDQDAAARSMEPVSQWDRRAHVLPFDLGQARFKSGDAMLDAR